MKQNLKIKHISATVYNFKLKKPYVISSQQFFDMPGAIIKIELENGITGFGEAQAYDTLLNENSESISHAIGLVRPFVEKQSIYSLSTIMQYLETTIPQHRAAMCGIDMALYDALGKYLEIPVSVLLGGNSYPVCVNAAIGMQDIKSAEDEIKELYKKNYQIFKIKVGRDIQQEYQLVKMTREIVGNRKIFIDANCGWSDKEQALHYIKRLDDFSLAWVEQPLAHSDISGHQFLVSHSPVPIMLDESIYTPSDALALLQQNGLNMINVKLSKSGGLYNALAIASIAKSANIPIMIGSNLETGLGCLANYQFAKAVDCITTSVGTYRLMDSNFEHPLQIHNGYATVEKELPGLGYNEHMEDQLKLITK